MKKTGLLNVRLSAVVAGMGHGDLLVIADAGLPIPPGVECVDLAVRPGTPAFLDVLDAVLGELHVERFVLAEELLARDALLPEAIRARVPGAAEDRLSHEAFKQQSAQAKAIVRTGECVPYSNVMLVSGVTF